MIVKTSFIDINHVFSLHSTKCEIEDANIYISVSDRVYVNQEKYMFAFYDAEFAANMNLLLLLLSLFSIFVIYIQWNLISHACAWSRLL